jgi:hypothetical protein
MHSERRYTIYYVVLFRSPPLPQVVFPSHFTPEARSLITVQLESFGKIFVFSRHCNHAIHVLIIGNPRHARKVIGDIFFVLMCAGSPAEQSGETAGCNGGRCPNN